MKKRIHQKVAVDLYAVQMAWTKWFLGIALAVHVIKMLIALNTGEAQQEDFFLSTYVATNIYMLVIGIIGAYGIFPFFVGNGITRRDYFKGAALGSLGLALTIGIASAIITGLEYFLVKVLRLPIEFINTMGKSAFESDGGNLIGNILKMIVISPYFDISDNWFLSLFVYVLFAFNYYLIGWLIGSSFYCLGQGAGFAIIVVGIVFSMIGDILWGFTWGKPFSRWFPIESLDLPPIVSAIGSALLVGLILSLIRLITKRAVIKL